MSSAEIVAAVDQFLAGALNADQPTMRAAVIQFAAIDRDATCYQEAEAVRAVIAALVEQAVSNIVAATGNTDDFPATFKIVGPDAAGSPPPDLVALGRIMSCAANGHPDEIHLHLEHLEPEQVSNVIAYLANIYRQTAGAARP